MELFEKLDTSEKNINTALQAALAAGREILDVYGSDDFEVEKKGDDSPLTLADRRAHAAIVERLKETGLPILSEEEADIPIEERGAWDEYWLVDPLDGTKEFIKRNGEFTVNIALMRRRNEPERGAAAAERDAADTAEAASAPDAASSVDGSHAPAVGLVYVPVKDELYLGIEGRGAWKIEGAAADGGIESVEQAARQGRRLPVQDPLARGFAAVISRSHNSPESDALLERLEAEHGPVARVSSGSSIKLCLVAEGRADVYPRFAPTMEWDTAAGDGVCRAAGCRVTRKDERTPLSYNKADVLNPWFVVMGPRLFEKS
jgi:3'(2'), 5'-bisphosphate nucleotidase